MDLITLLTAIPAVGPYLPYLLLAGALASVAATALPPPAVNGSATYAGIYRTVNWLALNIGHAKNAGDAQAPIKPPVGTIGALIAMVLALGVVSMLSACTQPQVTASLDDLKTGCAALAIAETANPLTGGAAQTAAKVQAPFDAFCRIVDSGVIPGNADANSLAWVQTGATTVSTIVALAKSP